MRSLYRYVHPSKFRIYGFADDHQLWKSFLPVLQVTALKESIDCCFNLITKWMQEYFLCLNTSKTKLLVIMPPTLKDSIVVKGTFIDNKCVRFVSNAKKLGIVLNDELSFETQVTQVVKSCFNIIRKLSKMKSFLTQDQLRTLVSACVFSKLDYCNALYYGISAKPLKKLRSVQNSAVYLLRKKENCNISIEEYLRKYHWLPIKERIIFKILLIVHKCLNGNAPSELCNLFEFSSSSRTCKLNHISYKTAFGDRAFSVAGPRLWNILPSDIRMMKDVETFKVLLKTYLFNNSEIFIQKINER